MNKNVLFVLSLSLIFTFFNSIGAFYGFLNKPINTVYLGTIHYFEDYFLYVNNFFQGAHGALLTANRYTSEITPHSIPYWTDLWSGKLGSLFGLSPIASYHLSLAVVTMLTIVMLSVLLHRMFPKSKTLACAGFLFALLATSFMNHIWVDGKPMWYPFQLWRTPHFAFDRLGGVPHQTLQSLIFFLLTILSFSQNTHHQKLKLIILGILAFTLATLNPIQAVVFLAAFLGTQGIIFIQKKHRLPVRRIFILLLVTAATFMYMYVISTTLPHSQARAWDGTQHTTTTLPFLIMSIGPLSILFLLGFLPSLVSGNPLFIFASLVTAGSYALFLSKIPQTTGISNLRIIFPALYPFMGAIAVNGMLVIAQKLHRVIPIRKSIFVMIVLFIPLSLPTLFWEIEQKIQSQSDTTNQTIYLPVPIFDAFQTLSTTGRFDDVVLANPITHMDTLVPALSGHSVYSGHMLLTIRSEEKKQKAQEFYSGQLSTDAARSFLINNNIRYVLFTSLDGDITRLLPLEQSGDLGVVGKMGANVLFLVKR